MSAASCDRPGAGVVPIGTLRERPAGQTPRGVLRAGDSAYRYGGEEFVALILLPQPSEALAAANRMRTAIESLQIPNARNAPYGHLTTSVGVTTIGPRDLSADDASWLARADAALYRAKTNGRNRAEVGPRDANADGRIGGVVLPIVGVGAHAHRA